ncbi:MAG TPA: hypothetical protein IAD23_05740 [Candidatus Scubalenecus merdavium]|uniref:Uncharacterized protein n=1 Tax=Candidatus Scybalenecus merdavium TaxID=2840939 RepID=A0A9D1MUP3_9FIRM|nr:hypothetical protein [Candidatus Scubalenecus merdavium]
MKTVFKVKRIWLLLLMISFVLSLAACSAPKESVTTEMTTESTTKETTTETTTQNSNPLSYIRKSQYSQRSLYDQLFAFYESQGVDFGHWIVKTGADNEFALYRNGIDGSDGMTWFCPSYYTAIELDGNMDTSNNGIYISYDDGQIRLIHITADSSELPSCIEVLNAVLIDCPDEYKFPENYLDTKIAENGLTNSICNWTDYDAHFICNSAKTLLVVEFNFGKG